MILKCQRDGSFDISYSTFEVVCMSRKIYISDGSIALCEYSEKEDGLDKIFAGCYPHNAASARMLEKCGFIPHPQGNLNEKHYLTGEDITQYDFVRYNTGVKVSGDAANA